MFSNNLKRSFVSLAVTAGFLAAAGPAAASPAASPNTPAQTNVSHSPQGQTDTSCHATTFKGSRTRTNPKQRAAKTLPRGIAPLSVKLEECMISG